MTTLPVRRDARRRNCNAVSPAEQAFENTVRDGIVPGHTDRMTQHGFVLQHRSHNASSDRDGAPAEHGIQDCISENVLSVRFQVLPSVASAWFPNLFRRQCSGRSTGTNADRRSYSYLLSFEPGFHLPCDQERQLERLLVVEA